jgi:hypothetical protein
LKNQKTKFTPSAAAFSNRYCESSISIELCPHLDKYPETTPEMGNNMPFFSPQFEYIPNSSLYTMLSTALVSWTANHSLEECKAENLHKVMSSCLCELGPFSPNLSKPASMQVHQQLEEHNNNNNNNNAGRGNIVVPKTPSAPKKRGMGSFFR